MDGSLSSCALRARAQAKANVNHQNAKHVTALNLACKNTHEGCALLLLKAGADPDVKDDWGDSPRSIATSKGLVAALAAM